MSDDDLEQDIVSNDDDAFTQLLPDSEVTLAKDIGSRISQLSSAGLIGKDMRDHLMKLYGSYFK